MGRLKRLAWVLALLVLPLLLMGWSSLQSWRADSALEEAQIMRQWLANPSDALLARLPREERKLVIDEDTRRQRFQRIVEQTDADRGGLHLRQVLATLSHWLAIAALLAGPATWLKLRVDAWRAVRSRDFLHDHLSLSWRALSQCLMVHTALLMGSLGLALLYELSWAHSTPQAGTLAMLLMCLPVVPVLYVGALLILRLRQRWLALDAPCSTFLGRTLSRADAPGLWAWIESLARPTGAPVPDHIVVGIDQSFFVTSVEVMLQPSGQLLSGRTLYLPLTYLSCMSQDEAASVIGHELGHFSSRDTERGSEVGARFRLMCLHFSVITGEGTPPSWLERPAIWMAERFLHHLQIAVQHWSRAQELVADRAGAQVAGPRLFCQALLRVIALDGAIDALLHQRQRQDLIQALAEHLRVHPLCLSEEVLGRAVPHPFDSHPPTALRLQQLGVMLDAQLLAEATRQPTDYDRHWFGQLASPSPATTAS